MNKDMLIKMLRMMASENDTDAIMGLRGLQRLLKEDMLNLESVLAQALGQGGGAGGERPTPAAAAQSSSPPSVSLTTTTAQSADAGSGGMPTCKCSKKGVVQLTAAGRTAGTDVALPGLSADHAEDIAAHLNDALIAASINKSRFKLKLNDILNNKGEVVETAIQAEYERQGMSPVRIWVNTRGEVGALATVLRKAVAAAFPDLWQT